MELAISNNTGAVGDELISVSDAIFGRKFNQDLVHQAVVSYRNAGRSGTKAQKTRSEVSGTTKKSKNQKGSGGARHGALTAPIFVGGGVTFAAKPRSFAKKLNRKMYRAAIASILSELNRQKRLHLVEQFNMEAGESKTKLLVAKLARLGVDCGVLIVVENASESLHLSARNLPHVVICNVQSLNPVSLVGAKTVIMTTDAVKKIERWLA